MINIEDEEKRKTTALLVGKPGEDLSELKGLSDTLGLEVLRLMNLTRVEVTPAYGMGKGKAEEISALAQELGADIIIFDWILEPRKQRNWEKLSKRPCIDRQEVILRIFSQRAKTKEAVLQVQLARLEYSLPRLAHSYGDMARQRGGNFGAKGSGETQLELDSREVRDKITRIKRELKDVVQERQTQQKKRRSLPIPQVALAGYTNAGKSSLMNALTGSDVFVEDKLFATLDPTTRKLRLKTKSEDSGSNILLTDTVGFISNLPHSLVNAFKSTLEEAQKADLILLVLDASDINAESEYKTVIKVLEEIGADKNPRVVVLNKIDKLEDNDPQLTGLSKLFPDCVKISAKTGAGIQELSCRITQEIMGKETELTISVEESALIAQIRKTGILLEENWLEDGIHIKIQGLELKGNLRLKNLLKPFLPEIFSDDTDEKEKKSFRADW